MCQIAYNPPHGAHLYNWAALQPAAQQQQASMVASAILLSSRSTIPVNIFIALLVIPNSLLVATISLLEMAFFLLCAAPSPCKACTLRELAWQAANSPFPFAPVAALDSEVARLPILEPVVAADPLGIAKLAVDLGLRQSHPGRGRRQMSYKTR